MADLNVGTHDLDRDSSRNFDWEDPLDIEAELAEEERMVRDTVRGYAQEKLMARVLTAYRDERFDREMFVEMGALGGMSRSMLKLEGRRCSP